MAKKPRPGSPQDRKPVDPGPNVPDPSPLNGQIGEGASLPSGERIARMARNLEYPPDSPHDSKRGIASGSPTRTPGSAEGERDPDEQSR
jgi:hypothetical protein